MRCKIDTVATIANCSCSKEFIPVAAAGPSQAKDRPIRHRRSGRPGRSVQEQLRRKCKRPTPKIRCASWHSRDGGPRQLFARIYAPLAHYRHSPLQGARKERQGIRKQESYYKHGQRRNEDNLPDLQNSDMAVDMQNRRIAERQDHLYLAWLQLKVHAYKCLPGLLDNEVSAKCRGRCLICCRSLSATPPHLIFLSAQRRGFFHSVAPKRTAGPFAELKVRNKILVHSVGQVQASSRVIKRRTCMQCPWSLTKQLYCGNSAGPFRPTKT
jgi:hypothetical protein